MHLSDIMNEKKPIMPEFAARMGRYFGNGGEVWLRMQQRFDLATVEHDKAAELAAIRPAERRPEPIDA